MIHSATFALIILTQTYRPFARDTEQATQIIRGMEQLQSCSCSTEQPQAKPTCQTGMRVCNILNALENSPSYNMELK